MAMQILAKAKFEATLVGDYGCRKVTKNNGFDLWENHEHKAFTVPHSEEDGGGYPDFILDELISQGKLVFGSKPVQLKSVNEAAV